MSGILAAAMAGVTLQVTANNVSGFASGPDPSGPVQSNATTTTVTGGSGTYTYSWTHVSTTSGPTPNISSVSIQNPIWGHPTVDDTPNSVSTWKVTVTDTFYNISASANISVTLNWNQII